MPYLSKIMLYPFKSLDGIEVEQATLLASSALQWDRTFALFDAGGTYINGKHNAKIHQIRSFFDIKEQLLMLRITETGSQHIFHLEHQREELNAWFSEYFGQQVTIQQNFVNGFPDDLIAPGPTVIGVSTLESISSWFPGTDPTTFRRRFRANLELSDAEPFWEDRLYGDTGTFVRFRVGSAIIEGTNPCKRCVVPSRDPQSGEMYPRFQKTFTEKRAEYLPEWANRSRFNHFYRLAINTHVPETEAGKEIHVGDKIELV